MTNQLPSEVQSVSGALIYRRSPFQWTSLVALASTDVRDRANKDGKLAQTGAHGMNIAKLEDIFDVYSDSACIQLPGVEQVHQQLAEN